MSYIHDLRAELEQRLEDLEQFWREDEGLEACDARRDALIKFILEKVLESYKNGLDATKLRVNKAEGKLKRPARKKGITAAE